MGLIMLLLSVFLFNHSKLQHPNIVDFYGACMKAPNFCMVMELCEMSLFTLLHQTTEELGPKRLTNMLVIRTPTIDPHIPTSSHESLKCQSNASVHGRSGVPNQCTIYTLESP
jgi:hypothetical protein